MNTRAEVLAARLERGVSDLVAFAGNCTDTEWRTVVTDEQRPVGVLIHHVASAYTVETDLVQVMASGQAIEGVTWDMVEEGNAEHADAWAQCTKEETLELLKRNSGAAADAIRKLSDSQLDFAAPISLNWDTPLTTQYFIEEHPLSHAYRHLANIRKAIEEKVYI